MVGRSEDVNQLGVAGVPLGGELPGKLLEDTTIGIESPGFCFYSLGLKRGPLADEKVSGTVYWGINGSCHLNSLNRTWFALEPLGEEP